MEPIHNVCLERNSYDFILDTQINCKDWTLSWVALVSQEYQFVQMLRLKDLMEDQVSSDTNSDDQDMLGGDFIQSKEDVRIQLDNCSSIDIETDL